MDDYLIIGGGVLGLLQARELLAEGAQVTLLEGGRCGREASWAGGGIVSPLYPWRYSQPITALASWAQDYYPQLAAALWRECGIDTELQQCGLLMLEAEERDQALAWAHHSGRPMEPVGRDFIHARAELLAEGFGDGLWMPTIANIRNPRLLRALVASVADHPRMQLVENCPVTAFETDDESRVTAAVSHGDTGDVRRWDAGEFLIAAGAWSGTLLSTLGLELPVRPVRGQMLLYAPKARLLDCIVLYNGRYLIPRQDNRILVGSTLEEVGFDAGITTQGRDSLRESAQRMLPCLEDCPIERQWAGLRPGTPDGMPYIGRVPGYRNLHVNAGHYRNGLVLAPASARLLADLLLGRPPIVDPLPYAPTERIA